MGGPIIRGCFRVFPKSAVQWPYTDEVAREQMSNQGTEFSRSKTTAWLESAAMNANQADAPNARVVSVVLIVKPQ